MVFCHIQGKTVNSFSKSNLKSIAFTGVEVFNETVEDVFKGTTAAESFLYITVIDIDPDSKSMAVCKKNGLVIETR